MDHTPVLVEPRGLDSAEATARLRRDGPNLLPQPERRRWPRILGDAAREPMLLLLACAAGLYLALGDAGDAAVLGGSVLGVLGISLFQELRSERALQALRELGSPRARVLRDGRELSLPGSELVVGDCLLLGEGERVPADATLLDSAELALDESLLTGESLPVARSHRDRARVRAGTLVVRGHALAEVVATGARTEMGRIGLSLRGLHAERTPLQREMRRVVALFAAIGLGACALMVLLYWLRSGDRLQALLAGITLAMSNIPEEFPVVLSVFLALGGWRMARQRVLVRRPPAIEALGAVTVLCVDKTGTLTENRMALIETVPAPSADSTQGGDAESGDSRSDDVRDLAALLRCARRASARLGHDAMDRALLADAAPEIGQALRSYPVASGRPLYAQLWREADPAATAVLACKGAPEAVVALCGLPPPAQAAVLAQVAAMARRGLRVLGAAEAALPPGTGPDALPEDPRDIPGYRWRGLLGFADPLRPNAAAAVAEARAAGIRVVMLTGDHPDTARSIAHQAGLETETLLTGDALAALEPEALAAAAARCDVFARVRPEDKLRLVQALAARGEVVAMTGDGVNDAPALMAAHVGVAMGARGTEVAREAAAIVLLDDAFASVVRAVRMGRTIYDNIRRAARYIIAVHIPITGLALLPLLLDAPLLLLPLHIVFLETIVDPACSIVFEREPADADVMRRPPRRPNARLIDRGALAGSVGRGLAALAAVVAVYLAAAQAGLSAPMQAALAFAALVCCNLALILVHLRDAPRGGRPIGRMRWPNAAFWAVATLTLSALAAVSLLPTPAAWFGFAVPPPAALALAVSLPPLWLIALELLPRRRRAAAPRATRAD